MVSKIYDWRYFATHCVLSNIFAVICDTSLPLKRGVESYLREFLLSSLGMILIRMFIKIGPIIFALPCCWYTPEVFAHKISCNPTTWLIFIFSASYVVYGERLQCLLGDWPIFLKLFVRYSLGYVRLAETDLSMTGHVSATWHPIKAGKATFVFTMTDIELKMFSRGWEIQ